MAFTKFGGNGLEFSVVFVSTNDGKLETTCNIKPTAKNDFILFKSFHSKHVKKAIPYGQFIHLKRLTYAVNLPDAVHKKIKETAFHLLL